MDCHEPKKYCDLNKQFDINEIVGNHILHDSSILIGNICRLCYKQFVSNNMDYILYAIDNGNVSAMRRLGYYYQFYNINYDLMKKYYLMAIEKNDCKAMTNIGLYYDEIEHNGILFTKYLMMAINNGYDLAMYNLGLKYLMIGQYNLMEKYYIMAAEKGNVNSMCQLGIYYASVGKFDEMKKYYVMAIARNDWMAMNNMAFYCYTIGDDENMKKYFKMGINTNYEKTTELALKCGLTPLEIYLFAFKKNDILEWLNNNKYDISQITKYNAEIPIVPLESVTDETNIVKSLDI